MACEAREEEKARARRLHCCCRLPAPGQAALKQENEEAKSRQRKAEVTMASVPMSLPSDLPQHGTLLRRCWQSKQRQQGKGGKQDAAPLSRQRQAVRRVPTCSPAAGTGAARQPREEE